MANDGDSHQPVLVSAWIIWVGFLLTLAIYVGICEIMGTQSGSEANSGFATLWIRTAFYVIAIVLFPVISGLKQLIFKNTSPATKSPDDSPRPGNTLIKRYLAGLVLAFGLANSIGTLGFLLFLMGDDYRTLYMFIGISVICMLIHRPKREEFDQLMR